MPKILLAGYLGCGNLGDDAVMLGVVDKFGPEIEYSALSGFPEETYRTYNIPGIARKEMKSVEKAIQAADALVFPGGSIFQDATSVMSVMYYAQLIKIAKKNGKKVILLGQGVGPLSTWLGKRTAAQAFNSADLVVCRDPSSVQALRELGVKSKVHLGADSAFLLPPPVVEEGGTFSVGSMKSVAIAPRPLDKKGVNEVALFGEFCRLVFQAGQAPTLVEMDAVEDGPIIDAISKQQGGRIPQLRKLGSPITVQQRLARMDSVVAMRLHAGILATTVGVPPLMISYDPKVAAFAKQLDLGSALPVEGLTPARLFDAYQAHQKQSDALRAKVESRRKAFLDQAMTGLELARETLGLAKRQP